MLPSKQHTRSPSQEPHEPPQPSVPQIFSERSSPQSGVQHEPAKHISPWAVLHDPQSTPPVPVPHQRPSQPFGRQVPDSQNLSAAHSPQVPPQPSSPHSIPAHCCLQHWPSAHLKPASHLPQPSGRPQLSSPHFAEPQTGTQHVPAMQGSPSPHCPHCPPQPSSPHSSPAQLGVQHVPRKHVLPSWQLPHVPPQPSSPHSRPWQNGSQQVPSKHTWGGLQRLSQESRVSILESVRTSVGLEPEPQATTNSGTRAARNDLFIGPPTENPTRQPNRFPRTREHRPGQKPL